MLRNIAGHVAYANVMATIAVFIALGGGAYAAISIPANSIGASQLKSESVGASEIKKGSITGTEIKGGTLKGDLFKKNTVTGDEIKAGAIGASEVAIGALLAAHFKPGQLPPGPPGTTGPRGEAGPQGPKGDTGAPPQVEGFKSAGLLNGFANYDEFNDGTADVPVRFWKDPFGMVHLEGAVERSSVPADWTTILQLPPGYRPAGNYYLSFPVITTGAADTDEQIGYVQVADDGRVDFNGGKVGYLSLTGVTFRAG